VPPRPYDIVAPIKVAGRHVANVYLGEARPPTLDFESVWPCYRELLVRSRRVRRKATKSQLRDSFNDLPVRTPAEIHALSKVVDVLGKLISQRATRQAAVLVALDAAHEVGATLNLQSSLSIYLRHARRLLNGNTGAIFLLSKEKDSLVSYAHQWNYPEISQFPMDVNGPGLVAKCARENLARYHGRLKEKYDKSPNIGSRAYVIRANTRKSIESLGEAAFEDSRDQRKLQSIMVVPIACGHELWNHRY